MAKFAVIQTGGKQYKFAEGDVLNVERLESGADKKVIFDKVLLTDDGTSTRVGVPYLDSAKVEADLLGEKKGRKVEGVKYKAKSNRRTKYGHRQIHSQVKITSVI